MKIGYDVELDNRRNPTTEAAHKWTQEACNLRPLQPFEDFYKSVRAFEAGAEWQKQQESSTKNGKN